MSIDNQVQQANRQIFGLGVYRFFVGFAFLATGFSTFPGAVTFIALSYIMIGLSVGGVLEFVRMTALVENKLMDAGERKTRHAILTAQRWALRGEPATGGDFWEEVDRAVQRELAEHAEPGPGFWKSAGLVLLNASWRLVGDITTIFIAGALAT